MTSRKTTTGCGRRSDSTGRTRRWVVCLLAVLALGLGRPGWDSSANLATERETDPVEQEESSSEVELAIHTRVEFRGRVGEQSAAQRPLMRITAGHDSPLATGNFTRLAPHDFDLRNGVGAALRC